MDDLRPYFLEVSVLIEDRFDLQSAVRALGFMELRVLPVPGREHAPAARAADKGDGEVHLLAASKATEISAVASFSIWSLICDFPIQSR